MSDKITETAPVTSQGRSTLPCESVSVLATRMSGPTPVVTHSVPVTSVAWNRPLSWSSGHRQGVAIVPPLPRCRGPTGNRIPTGTGNRKLGGNEVSVYTICEWDLGATGPITAEKPSEIAETVSRPKYTYRVIDQKQLLLLRFWLIRKVTQNQLITQVPAQIHIFTILWHLYTLVMDVCDAMDNHFTQYIYIDKNSKFYVKWSDICCLSLK